MPWLAARGVAPSLGRTLAHARKVAGAAISRARVMAAALAADSKPVPVAKPSCCQVGLEAQQPPDPSRDTWVGMASPTLPEGVLGRKGCFFGTLCKGRTVLGLGRGGCRQGVLSGAIEALGGLGGILPRPPTSFPLDTGTGFRRALQMLW